MTDKQQKKRPPWYFTRRGAFLVVAVIMFGWLGMVYLTAEIIQFAVMGCVG